MARTVGLPRVRTSVSRRSRQLIRLGVEHPVEDLRDLLRDHPVELGPRTWPG